MDIVFNYISFFILGITGIFLNLLINIYYGSEILGVFNQVLATYIVSSMVGSLGINFSVIKAVAENSNNLKVVNYIVVGALIPTIIFSFLNCLLYQMSIPLVSEILESQAVAIGMNAILPGIFLFSINKVLLAVINGRQRMRVFAIFQSLRYLFILFVLSYFISISLEGEKLAAIFSIAEFLLFIILVLDLFLNLKLSFSKNCFEWIKIHILYGLKASVGGVFIEMNSRIDVLMIGIFLSDKYVGIYSFAALFAEGFYQLFVVLQNLYNPIIAKLISSNKIGELIITISQARKIIMPTAIFLGSVGIILFKNLIKLSFFSNDLEISFLPFVILIAGSVLASGYIPFLNILTMADFPIWNSILIAYTVIANVFLNLYLIPNFGLNGAAIATSIALCSSTFILKIISKKLLRINF